MNAADAFRSAILAALGAAPDLIEPGRIHRFSTSGRSIDKAGWCQLFEDGRAGVFGDFRSRMSAVWTAQRRELMTPAERADMARQLAQSKAQREAKQRQQWADNAQRNETLWANTLPVSDGDPVSLYLRHRLPLAPGDALAVPDVIRWHPALPYWHDDEYVGRWSAMVAALHSPEGDLVALHRTWLCTDGSKAPTPGPCKKLTPAAGPVIGGCIRLVDSAEWSGAVLGIAEGIETALAARQASAVPTVAAYSAGALAGWRWPPALRRIVVFADADPAGAGAADKLRQRARKAGLSVSVLTPSTPGMDWADVWSRRAEVME